MTTKYCPACKKEKTTSSFARNTRRHDGLQNYCKVCKRKMDSKYYQDNIDERREKIAARNQNTRRVLHEYVWEYLSSHPCTDCPEKDPIVLDFDHRRDKVMSISQMVVDTVSLDTLKKEIEKCEVRCANCHRRRTHTVGNHWKAQFQNRRAL